MKLAHKVPCRQCPWRDNSLQGYLGGTAPEVYADAVRGNHVPVCHMNDYGPDDSRSAFCAGALATMKNACIAAYTPHGAEQARQKVDRRDDCFVHPIAFYEYHAGKSYVSPFLRGRDAEEA
jgi:hypothetical protein